MAKPPPGPPLPVATAKKKKTKPKTPQQQAQRNVQVQAATQALTDPFVGINKHGKLVAVKNPALAVKVFGQPLTRSQFLREQSQVNDLYLSFTGKKATPKQVAHILTTGMSTYQIKAQLSKTKAFIGSPVWRQNAPGYQSVWDTMYGPDGKPDDAEIRYAIVNNLGGEGFAQRLRQRADYVTSNEFKGNEATLSAVYSRIYGLPGASGEAVVKTAVLNGWNQDQFASYLRAQPQYTNSEEFQTKALGLASALGMVVGGQPTLQQGFGGANVNPNTQGALKPDPRVMPGGIEQTTGLTVSGGQKETGIAGVVNK
jgi:hypothetical protein